MKRTFTDINKLEWTPEITLYTAARAKRNLDIHLEDFDDLTAAILDPVSRLDLLYLVVEDEAIKRDISSETFGKSLAGDSIKSATEALLYAIADFLEDPKKRTAFLNMIEAMQKEANAISDHIIEKAPQIREAIRAKGRKFRKDLDEELQKTIDESETDVTTTS